MSQKSEPIDWSKAICPQCDGLKLECSCDFNNLRDERDQWKQQAELLAEVLGGIKDGRYWQERHNEVDKTASELAEAAIADFEKWKGK